MSLKPKWEFLITTPNGSISQDIDNITLCVLKPVYSWQYGYLCLSTPCLLPHNNPSVREQCYASFTSSSTTICGKDLQNCQCHKSNARRLYYCRTISPLNELKSPSPATHAKAENTCEIAGVPSWQTRTTVNTALHAVVRTLAAM